MQEERLMGLGLFRLEKGRRRLDLIAALHYVKGSDREDQRTLFSMKGQQRTDMGNKMRNSRYEEKNSSVRLAEPGDRLLRKAAEMPS